MNILHRLAIVPALAIAGAAFAQSASDAVSVDPDVHHVILDNEHVRVFDARASRGTKSPMHTHPPRVLVSIGMTRLRMTMADGKTSIFDLNPGDVLWMEDSKHSWELLAGELHVIGVEIKSAQKGVTPPARTAEQRKGDAVVVDPATHHVLFENPHVLVFEGRASHGATSPMHSHPATVLVSLDAGRMQFTLPDGKLLIHDFSPGKVQWFAEGGNHSWVMHSGNARVIAIEVKSAQAATP